MDNSREELRRRISFLRSKIKTTLAFAQQDQDYFEKSFSALQKNILEYLTKVEISVNKIQLLFSFEVD